MNKNKTEKKETKKEKRKKKRVLIMDNLVLISKKNMAKDDIDCELQNENVELARTIFEFERTLYFIKESCKWFFEKYIYFNFIIK